jgi:dCTP deaminase
MDSGSSPARTDIWKLDRRGSNKQDSRKAHLILSNVAIVRSLAENAFTIEGLSQTSEPFSPPFQTSAVDLTLAGELTELSGGTAAIIDVANGDVRRFLQLNSSLRNIEDDPDRPFLLKPGSFILGKTREFVDFPLADGESVSYAARVEGRSSLARCGLVVHLTAPTIHAGFRGTITLEIANLGPTTIILRSGMKICQLIIEEVRGTPQLTDSQFRDQTTTTGLPSK